MAKKKVKAPKYGAPRKFNTVEEMQKAIDVYYKKQTLNTKPLTVQGLAIALDFTSRTSLLNYEGYTDDNDRDFLNTIKRARLFIENHKVEGLISGDYPAAGVIFDLKNNHGHKDKQVREVVKADDLEDGELGDRIKKLEGKQWR
jgi:L-ribulose-5-phosphate 3-epimerase UlaE